MPTTSQFRIFQSTDLGAPKLMGITGSLIDVLDACLVNGYGNTAPLGWLKPMANESGSFTDGLMRACYKQPSGSGFTLMINDNAPTGSTAGSGAAPGAAGVRAAWAVGWEYLLGMTGSGIQNIVGTGSGQFPYPGLGNLVAGLSNNGAVEWQKSYLITLDERYWILFGDAYTFYLFVQHEWNEKDTYSQYGFGDFYSTKINRSDNYKCMIIGRIQTSANSSISIESSDYIVDALFVNYQGTFAARGARGIGSAVPMNRVGDAGKCQMGAFGGSAVSHYGIQNAMCDAENAFSFAPIQLVEVDTTYNFRGRFRGMYHPTCQSSYVYDGQEISGSNHHAGKIFRIVKKGNNNGIWAIEISNTVETNDY